MKVAKISLYKELYYWMYWTISSIYTRISKTMTLEYQNSGIGAAILFSTLNMFNAVVLDNNIITHLLSMKNIKYDEDLYSKIFMFLVLLIFLYNLFFTYRKLDKIVSICEQFSTKRRIIGNIVFWIYVILSNVLLLTIDSLLK